MKGIDLNIFNLERLNIAVIGANSKSEGDSMAELSNYCVFNKLTKLLMPRLMSLAQEPILFSFRHFSPKIDDI